MENFPQYDDVARNLLLDFYGTRTFLLCFSYEYFYPIKLLVNQLLQWFFSTLDILVIGVGDLGNRLSPSVVQYIRSKNINMEMLPTERACAVFNFLNVENRNVAAALIPPLRIKIGEDDIATHMRNTRNFLVARDE